MRKIPKYKPDNEKAAADVHGPWVDPLFTSWLVELVRKHWDTPISQLPNNILAMFLRQQIAVRIARPIARARIAARYVDGTELHSDELHRAANKPDHPSPAVERASTSRPSRPHGRHNRTAMNNVHSRRCRHGCARSTFDAHR